MGRYRKVDVKIWNDAKFLKLSKDGKLVFIYILTHPNLTGIGAMKGTIPGLAAEIGWEPKVFSRAFKESVTQDMVTFCSMSRFIALKNFLKYNVPESPNVVKSWGKIVDLIPECEAQVLYFKHVKAFTEGLGEAFSKALPKAFAEGSRKPSLKAMPNQEQEQEQEQNKKPTKKRKTPVKKIDAKWDSKFDEFWEGYPRPEGKKKAREAWNKIEKKTDETFQQISESVAKKKKSEQWTKDDGQFIPLPASYLNQERWSDGETSVRYIPKASVGQPTSDSDQYRFETTQEYDGDDIVQIRTWVQADGKTPQLDADGKPKIKKRRIPMTPKQKKQREQEIANDNS